jgi:hypothetical protein
MQKLAHNISLRLQHRNSNMKIPAKAAPEDFEGRFREIISDPINLLIERVPQAGVVEEGFVWLHNGNRVLETGKLAYYQEFSKILSLNRGVHEPLEEYLFQEVIKALGPAPLMLELGAYWAHYSMWLKMRRSEASLVMVEPDEQNIAVGKYNFLENGYSGEFIQDFVGDGHFIVDDFYKERHFKKIDILHSDIQGYELQMLNGSKDILSKRAIDYVFISTHSQQIHTNVAKFLSEYDYRVEISSDFDHDTTSHDGLVFASSPLVPALFDGFRPLGRNHIAKATPKELLQSLTSRGLGAS